MEILRLLEKYSFISSYEILDYKTWETGLYYKIKIVITDNSIIYAREYISETERIYSFHWQDENENIITRWDNAPHYKNMSTYPHHKHENREIKVSREITLEDVLKDIAKRFNTDYS